MPTWWTRARTPRRLLAARPAARIALLSATLVCATLAAGVSLSLLLGSGSHVPPVSPGAGQRHLLGGPSPDTGTSSRAPSGLGAAGSPGAPAGSPGASGGSATRGVGAVPAEPGPGRTGAGTATVSPTAPARPSAEPARQPVGAPPQGAGPPASTFATLPAFQPRPPGATEAPYVPD